MLGHMLKTLPALDIFLVAGCSDPKLTVMNRSTGEVGQGSVQNSNTGNYDHISFSDETYTLIWAAVADPNTAIFSFFDACSTGGQILLQNTTGLFRTLVKT